jgi:hypothetical protein
MDKPWMEPSFAWWFVGLFEGEGCLYAKIYKAKKSRKPGLNLQTGAIIVLRDDDGSIIQRLQKTIGGKVYQVRRSGRKGNPALRWALQSGHDCARFCEILDAFPMTGKKVREYPIWKNICSLRGSKNTGKGGHSTLFYRRVEIEQLCAELSRMKEYQAPIVAETAEEDCPLFIGLM